MKSKSTSSSVSIHSFTSQAAITAAAGAPAPRILIVDHDVLVCGLHAAVLELSGYEVETAENGEDALTELACGHFDLVLTDRHLPILDGASLVLALRSAGSRIPVVMVSRSLAHEPLPPGVAREVSATLPKPARVAEILAAVAAALLPGLLAAAA